MQHFRTSAVLVEVLWFTSYSSCCLLSGWADVFFFRISDLCCTLAYNSSSVLKSWLVLCSIKSERCSLASLMRECEKPKASPASAANDLQCVKLTGVMGGLPALESFVGCSPAGLGVLYVDLLATLYHLKCFTWAWDFGLVYIKWVLVGLTHFFLLEHRPFCSAGCLQFWCHSGGRT